MEDSENTPSLSERKRTWFELLLLVFHQHPPERIREYYDYQFRLQVPPEYVVDMRKPFERLEATFPAQNIYLDKLVRENLTNLHLLLNILRPLFEDERMAEGLLQASESFGMHARLRSKDLEMQKLVRDLFSLTHHYRLQKEKARG